MTDCKHCGTNIVLVNYSSGPEWTHQPPGAAFQDGVHRYCETTTAEPKRACILCGCDLDYPTATHLVDCGGAS